MITVYGEGLIDLVPSAAGPLTPLVPSLGGGPFNVARALGRLGSPVAFQSRLSTDGFGEALVAALASASVDTTGVARGPEPTTLAVTSLRPDGSAAYTFYTEGTADRFAEPTPATGGFAVFGTVSLALEPAASRYAAAASASAAAGAVVCLDPNVRPFYATRSHREFLRSMLPSVTVLKMSDEEVGFMGDVSAVPVVVTTLGPAGIEVRAPFGTVRVGAPRTAVADTIGAGDTVMAALVHEFDARGLDRDGLRALDAGAWREILRFAATAAAITVSRRGADTPTRAEVLAAY
ncbi:PfkB family carbohydrate kinase [Corynebacterium timonense]|uniref:Fructokinase n=1 Tax=Corynebacterium timonense TaxID=441500 RepID=A0A1H1SR84_9CORY|nr:PfkB family carbohydrate kinase [Corynebacterium timonense]SDS50530.1 fructokinase [Corynebacterium timonense]